MDKNSITIQDLSLQEITLERLPRLKKLRDLHFDTKPEICLELPRLMTYYMRYLDNEEDSPELRSGKLNKYILENKKPVIIARTETEWVELVDNGFGKIVGFDKDKMYAAFDFYKTNKLDYSVNLYGDQVGERMYKEILKIL